LICLCFRGLYMQIWIQYCYIQLPMHWFVLNLMSIHTTSTFQALANVDKPLTIAFKPYTYYTYISLILKTFKSKFIQHPLWTINFKGFHCYLQSNDWIRLKLDRYCEIHLIKFFHFIIYCEVNYSIVTIQSIYWMSVITFTHVSNCQLRHVYKILNKILFNSYTIV